MWWFHHSPVVGNHSTKPTRRGRRKKKVVRKKAEVVLRVAAMQVSITGKRFSMWAIGNQAFPAKWDAIIPRTPLPRATRGITSGAVQRKQGVWHFVMSALPWQQPAPVTGIPVSASPFFDTTPVVVNRQPLSLTSANGLFGGLTKALWKKVLGHDDDCMHLRSRKILLGVHIFKC